MRSTVRFCWIAALAAAPWFATAAPVTFSFGSTVSQAVGSSGFPAGPDPGDQITFTVRFDSDAALTSSPQPGAFLFDPASISITYTAGSYSRTVVNAPTGGALVLRDNASDPDGISPAVDGLTFIAFDGVSDSVQVTLRGPTLDLITNGKLPTFQDERWDNQRLATFELCRRSSSTSNACSVGFVRSLVNPVPEPASLTLVALALAGLAASRRRASAG